MMAEKIVKLSRKYEAFGKVFDSVTLREPKLRDHFQLGDPVEIHSGPDGQGRFVIEHLDRVQGYLDRLAVPEKPGRECIDDLDLADSIALKQAVNDFFTEAHKRRARQTSSSSGQDSPST